MIELNSNIEVTRYTGDGTVTEAEAKSIISRLTTQFNEARMGRFVAIEKSTGEKIGLTEFAHGKDEDGEYKDFIISKDEFPTSKL